MLKKSSVIILLGILLLMVFATFSIQAQDKEVIFVGNEGIGVGAPEDWQVYKYTQDIQKALPNHPMSDKIALLVRDERNFKAFKKAAKEQDIESLMENFPTYYYIAYQKLDKKVDEKRLKKSTDNVIKQLERDDADYEVHKRGKLTNTRNGAKGNHVSYKMNRMMFMNYYWAFDNYLVTFFGVTPKTNDEMINMIHTLSKAIEPRFLN